MKVAAYADKGWFKQGPCAGGGRVAPDALKRSRSFRTNTPNEH
jgi:hypothetical protein